VDFALTNASVVLGATYNAGVAAGLGVDCFSESTSKYILTHYLLACLSFASCREASTLHQV